MLTSFGLDLTVVEKTFTALESDVQMLLFLQEADCHHCREIKRLLEKLSSITHKLNLEVYNFAINLSKKLFVNNCLIILSN
jgi:thioredoxin-related protein